MAERGEGIGTSGGSQSHTSVVPTLSSTSRIRNPSVSFTVEAAGAKRNPLPLRKRKLPVIENPKDSSVKSSKELSVLNLPLSDPILPNINCELPSPACKRRRVTSESSAASSRDLCLLEESIFPKSTSKRKKSPINSTSKVGHRTPAKNSGSKRRNSLPVTKNIFSESSSSTSRRRSTRGSYFLGFYAEGEQQLLAAFRDHTCELKSPPQLSNISTSQRRQNTNSKRPTSSRSRKSITSSTKRSKTVCKKHSSRASGSKMTEGKPSYGTDQYKNLCKVKTLEDAAELPSSGVSKRGSRRHTLPGRAELARVDMGVALSKCTSPPNENHDDHSDAAAAASVDHLLTESRPSTSGLAAALDDGLVPSTSSASTVLHQLMRRLPRKKKSVSEQDLSHVDPSLSSINAPLGHGSKKVERVSSSSFLKKHHDLSRRRSANSDQERTENSLIAEKGLDQLNEAEKGPISTLKSYPLRNRLRQREGDSPTPPSSRGVITANPTAVLNNSFPQASVTPTASADPSRFHLDPQSLSLPSSPSSPSSQGGVTILDAFRRLRDSRRMSQEQTQCAKDSKQSSVWKRGSSARRSPLSKRGSRNKSNSASNNSRVGTQSSLSSQLHFQMGLASSGANPIPLPPSSALSATSTASGLLPSSALSSLGAAIGGSGSSGGGTPSSGSSALGVGSLMAAAPGDSESEENEMGRLEALLASRGLPPSLFGALGPRMQHILHRSVSSSISSKAQQLLVGLQATGDESEQLQAVIEMCQLLVMGNEDTLAGFPIKQVTPALIILLNMEHNFDMMNHACRALTYMMEALPRSSSVVVDAVPAFLEKLQVIQCMDVAEQSLTALNMLSKKHSKAILHERGVSACLTYIDFFSSNAQRAALSITANCFQNLSADEFHFASDSLAILSSRLTTQGDKKCVESVCLAFSRLVDCFQTDSVKLQEIANHGLLTNTQQLLVMSPPVLSSGTFIMVIRMMSLMCTHCPELAVSLLKNNIAQTLCYLLTNYTEPPSEHVDLVPRSPQEMYEITCLIGELLPVLPSDGIFLIDSAISKPQGSSSGTLVWQWQDDRSQWHNYSQGDSRVIELAHQSGEDEISLCVNGNSYTLDFHSMQQINDNTGTMRSIVRRIVPLNASGISSVSSQVSDARAECLKEDTELATALIKSLFSLLYEVYSSSAGPAVRYKCLRALLRMIHFGRPELLQEVLKSQSVSSHLATMLSSVDLKIIVSALQMAALLMHKLPNVFSIYFRREGVMHQIKRLRDIEVALPSASAPVTPVATPKSKVGPASPASCPPSVSLPPPLSSGSSAVVVSVGSSSTLASSVYGCSLSSLLPSSSVTMSTALPPPPPLPGATAGSTVASAVYNGVDAASSLSIVSPPSTLMSPTAIGAVSDLPQVHGSNNSDEDKMASPHLRLPDVLKRRRQKPSSRSTPTSSGGSWRRGGVASRLVGDSGLVTPGPAPHSPTFSDFLLKNTGFSAGRDTWRAIGGGRSKMAGGSSTQSGSVGSSSSSSSSGGKTTASSFLANFNPVRWGRCNSAPAHPHDLTTNHGKDKAGSMNSLSPSSTFSVSSIVTSPPSNSINREQIRIWVRDQAKKLCDQYFKVESQGSSHPALTVMNRLIAAIQLLDSTPERAIPALSEISVIVMESDISPFEVIHSDLVRSLLTYLATPNASKSPAPVPPSSSILSSFNAGESLLGVLAAAASMGSSSNGGGDATAADSTQVEAASSIPAAKIPRLERIRSFLHVFLGYSLDPMSVNGFDPHRVVAFGALVAKLNGCVNQLEQFPVKVHDLPGAVLTGSGRGGSTSAIKFFNTHQLKCNLLRHPECSRLKQWRGGPVKVDPLALVQAIERYLVIRGYGRLRDEDEDHSDEDNSDQDIDDTLAAVSVSQSSNSHKLQFLIGDRVLPYNMTVYQAVRQFAANEGSLESEVDGEVPISHSSIWLQTHTIYYRPIQDDSSKPHSSRKGKGFSRPSPKKKSGESNSNSKCSLFGGGNAVLESQLTPKLPSNVTAKDPSLEVLALLRILHAVNRHCGSFYPSIQSSSPIAASEFINVKLAAKASRQLQDPLVIMTGNLPQWLPQIAYACPFVFPFETRQLLFYAVSFDRDRALQRLMDSAPELNSSDSSERVTPRLERRKRTVSREDILKQAETVIADLASSRAMLEIQYENEVGTGLGPTLEFYALVSRELQKADLELWRGDAVSPDGGSVDPTAKGTKYVVPGSGFYPLPLPKNIKSAHLTKIKAKFKFLGKFMAKAVMDSRMVDLNLHECVYKWLLSEEKSLCLSDIISMDPSLGQTLSKLQDVLLRKKKIQEEGKANGYTASQLQEKIETLTVDGCRVEDLCLNFTLPGFPNIELKKGGSDIEVNVSNIEQYMQSVLDWLLRDGVHRQLDAMREGFDSVFPSAQLRLFYPNELEQLFCGSVDATQWQAKQLADCIRPDHGYTHDSNAVKFLLQVLSEYSPSSQRAFLQFVTGSPRLPVGGFKSLSPPLTIVRKTFDASEDPDQFLPSVMTCVNYLKLPDYSSVDVMRDKLRIAYLEGQHSFHLS